MQLNAKPKRALLNRSPKKAGSRVPDPKVFGLPGSVSQRYGSRLGFGSGSFSHQTKIVNKLDFYCLVTSLWRIIFEEWCTLNVTSKSNEQKYFLLASQRSLTKSRIRSLIRIRKSEVRIHGSGSVPKCHGYGSGFFVPYTRLRIQLHHPPLFFAMAFNKKIIFYEVFLRISNCMHINISL